MQMMICDNYILLKKCSETISLNEQMWLAVKSGYLFIDFIFKKVDFELSVEHLSSNKFLITYK